MIVGKEEKYFSLNLNAAYDFATRWYFFPSSTRVFEYFFKIKKRNIWKSNVFQLHPRIAGLNKSRKFLPHDFTTTSEAKFSLFFKSCNLTYNWFFDSVQSKSHKSIKKNFPKQKYFTLCRDVVV